jgi:hypothetical protein
MHFGLGAYQTIDNMEIIWSTGETSHHQGPFTSGKTYTITRSEKE